MNKPVDGLANFALKLFPIAASLLLAQAAYAASYSFQPIDVPGAMWTQAFGINDRGAVVGSYRDASGEHGFLLIAGNLITINGARATITQAIDVNNRGEVVGWHNGHGVVGFLWSGGEITPIAGPDAYGTSPEGSTTAARSLARIGMSRGMDTRTYTTTVPSPCLRCLATLRRRIG